MAKEFQSKNIIVQEYKEIKENETLGRALSLFKSSTDVLVVLDQKKEYSGILVERAILRTDLDPEKTKVKSFKVRAPKVSESIEIKDCARLMIENNVLYLPVFHRGKVIGIISYTDLLQAPELQKLGNYTAQDLMKKTLTTATPKDTLSIVFHKFKESDNFSLPVVDEGRYIGTVQLHDTVNTIIQHKKRPDFGTKIAEKEHLLDLPIKNIMTKTMVSAELNTTISEIIDILIERNQDSVSIIDNNNQLQAVITVKDILKLLVGEEELKVRPKIQINSNVEKMNRSRIESMVTSFIEKYSSFLREAEVEVYIREHREKRKNQKLIYTRIQLHAHKEKFDATAEDWGEEHSLKVALEKVEKQLLKKKPSKKHPGKRSKQ